MFVNCSAFGRSIFALILSVAALATAVTARAGTFSSDGLFSTSGLSIWDKGPAFTLDTGKQFLGASWNVGPNTVGDVECFLGACAGARIGAETTGKFGVDYSLAVNSGSFGLLYPGRTTITVPDSVSSSGTLVGPVTIGTGFQGRSSILTNTSPLPTMATLQVTSPTLQASLGLDASFHAFAGAQVCVVACFGPAFGPIDFNGSQSIASINEGNSGKLTVLGNTVSAHQNFSGLGGLINASVNLPNLDSSSANTPGGFNGGILTSTKRDGIIAVNANLAQIAADAFGLPIPLSGNLGPFGYNLLQSNAGVALDVQQTLSFTPFADGSLLFSSAVTPDINGVVGAPTTRIDFNFGDDVTFLPGPVSGVSIEPVINLHGTVHNATDLVVNGDINVQALGLKIAGLSIGPLINEGLPGIDLGRINLRNDSFPDYVGTIMGSPIDLNFSCGTVEGGGTSEFKTTRICASTRYADLGEVFTDARGVHYDEIDLVSCSDYLVGDITTTPTCTYTFNNLSNPYVDGPTGPVFLAGDPMDFIFNHPGASATDAGENALLQMLGYAPGLPSFVLPDGASLASFEVPEPGSIAILGFVVAAFLTGRRRLRI
jgi:hypothetical protein